VILANRFCFRVEPTRATRYSLTVNLKTCCVLTVVTLAGMLSVAGSILNYELSSLLPPPLPREFRGAWVATVANIDWPSKPGLTTAEQKSELLALLDRAAQIKLNAIIFQVRPACDAMYASTLEPWSEYLTGTMGKAPEPFYDPLAFAVTEAHRRGLELHAWFNPYRARSSNSQSPAAANHVSKTRPQLVRQYGKYLWLDPGEREVQEYSLRVVKDVVERYDVDGVHFDDYFYPYKESAGGKALDFPDGASWKKFGAGGKLSRDDWRRENVNAFIERVYKSIKAAKPRVKFGVSPFGIWRPGSPAQIKGLDAYAELYADSQKWLANGWLDYFAPQLYWAIEPKDQSFPALLDWWNEQNPKHRHIWPGVDTTKVRSRWKPDEIVNQIRLAKKQPVSAGHVHWNLKGLLRSDELQAALERGAYAEPALIPACHWLATPAPGRPTHFISDLKSGNLRLMCDAAQGSEAWLWAVQTKSNGEWKIEIVPGSRTFTRAFGNFHPDIIAVTQIERGGGAGQPLVLAGKD
jgi:uncharacterized lipoprotein YddW (UPF0748 family)